MTRAIVLLVVCLLKLCQSEGNDEKFYSMYVWGYGFDPDVAGCKDNFLTWSIKKTPQCFTHTWDTEKRRKWLWDSLKPSENREISHIFLDDVFWNLKNAYDTKCCSNGGNTCTKDRKQIRNSPDIDHVRETLRQGHYKGLKIYGLYADSTEEVREKDSVKYIVYYNEHCAEFGDERFDGVAVNNEAFSKMKCDHFEKNENGKRRAKYLNNLNEIVKETRKGKNPYDGKLEAHFSIGWHWGICDDNCPCDASFTWNGKTGSAATHMIDIFDSVDVQVAYTRPKEIASRLKKAGYDHAVRTGKDMHVNLYSNQDMKGHILCQTTFFPDKKACPQKDGRDKDGNRVSRSTEKAMFAVFDKLQKKLAPKIRPNIHHFRGAYCSGGNQDWPTHRSK